MIDALSELKHSHNILEDTKQRLLRVLNSEGLSDSIDVWLTDAIRDLETVISDVNYVVEVTEKEVKNENQHP